jgi:simple sugar transport system ATP-binding protein
VVDTIDPKAETSRSMAEKMIGAGLKDIQKPAGRAFGEERLVVDGLSIPGEGHFGVALQNVSFTVRAGEIFGIAGVAGNGQNALLLALDGEVIGPDAGAIILDGERIGRENAKQRRLRGLCTVPEERNGHAAVADFTLADNAVLTGRDRLGMVISGMLRHGVARDYTGKVISTFSVKATGAGATAGSLSGGNLQKYIMGREILQNPKVLVVSQPTWGVDAGAAATIHQAIVDLAVAGSAIVVISQDLDELLALSDTLAVINNGRLSKPMPIGEVSIQELGLLMGGVHGETAAPVGREMADVV